MAWNPHGDGQGFFECRKCRARVLSFMTGQGLDLGSGPEKVCENAIGIDIRRGPATDVQLDLSAPNALRMFADASFDYVFSSHLLENLTDAAGALREWWRVLRPGGHLILYVPDPEYGPRAGTEGADPEQVADLTLDEVRRLLEALGNARVLSATRHNEADEYSWQLVARKEFALLRRPYEVLQQAVRHWSWALPRPRRAARECLVIRYGALGDAIWMTPVLRQLKSEGWHVVYHTTEYSAQVLAECPYIDEFLIQPQDGVINEQLPAYWESLGRHFDKVLNFSGSIEDHLLKQEGSPEYRWPHAERHRLCNVNYLDATMAWAGYPHLKGAKCELHFSEQEEALVRSLLATHVKDRFLLVWSLAGSSYHKHWPWTPYVCGEIWNRYPQDVLVVTVGDADCQMIEPSFPNVVRKCGTLGARWAMLLTKYAHLVVGPETGILNAAACWDNVPKVVMLSHSSPENLTKYWKNTTVIEPTDCPCHPCHQLHFTRNSCPMGPMDLACLCCENVAAETVFAAIQGWIRRWRAGEPPYGACLSCLPAGTAADRAGRPVPVPRKLRRRLRKVRV